MVRIAASVTIANNTDVDVPWDTAYYNDNSIWSAGQPTRLTVPTGATQVRVSCGWRWALNSSGNRKVRIRGNPGGTYPANAIWGADERPAGASGDCTVTTGIIPVTAGYYFVAVVTQDSGGNLDSLNATNGIWFCMEVIK